MHVDNTVDKRAMQAYRGKLYIRRRLKVNETSHLSGEPWKDIGVEHLLPDTV